MTDVQKTTPKHNGNGVRRIALVTGGIGGIGTEICKQLSTQGRHVVAAHLPGEADLAAEWKENLKAEGYDVDVATANVADFESSEAMVNNIIKNYGSIDIVVNCAGITRDKLLRKMDIDQWNDVLTTNLDSVFNVTRHVVDGMLERKFGRIVNISSVNGQKGQFGQTNYSAAKAGLHGFTMALAQEVAYKGITVNTVSPGYVDTNMTKAMPDDIRDQIVATIPIGRLGEPAEIANVVAFLCHDDSRYITGANIPVNGGLYMN